VSLAATKDAESGGGGCGEGLNKSRSTHNKSLQLIDYYWRMSPSITS
jgi:hypothetical protein